MSKESALNSFLTSKENIRSIAQALLDACDEHFGENPDEIHWATAGSLAFASQKLDDVCEFLNLDKGE